MPVYTYECEECGARFDAKQSFSDAPLTVCPTCEGKIHRVIQPVGVVFKGSGFYVTDSRGKQSLAASGTKKEESKSGEGGDTPTTTGSSTDTSKTPAAAETKSASATEAAKSSAPSES